MPLNAERIGAVLWISGNVDRALEKDLGTALEDFVKDVKGATPIVDMSHVRYLASSTAKILIGVAQDMDANGPKIKVRSSMPVVQTLNLLGGKTWVDIEVCAKPNLKGLTDETEPLADKPVEDKRASAANIAPVAPIHEGSVDSYVPTVHIRPAEPKPALALKPSESGTLVSVGNAGVGVGGRREKGPDTALEAAQARHGQPLELHGEVGAERIVLERLIVLGTYCFHVAGNEQDITGKVLEHVGGPWIVIDSKGSRRLINLHQVGWVDVLF